jgi:hypothetical protein
MNRLIHHKRKISNFSNNSSIQSNSENFLNQTPNAYTNYKSDLSYQVATNNQQSCSNNFKSKSSTHKSPMRENVTYEELITFPIHLLSTQERHEINDLSECTFKPKISNSASRTRSRTEENIFEYLHKNNRLNSERTRKKMIHHMMNESKECTFQPVSKKKRSLSFSNFMVQTQNYQLRKRLKLMSMILKRQQEEESKYTFTPATSKSFDLGSNSEKNQLPRHILLNREHQMKQERQRIRTLDYYQNVMAPHRPVSNMRSRSSSTSSLRSSIPNYHANKLYEDAREIRFKKLDLAREYYKSLTFKPQINEREVTSTFEERNQKLVQLKKELQEKVTKEQEDNRNSKKHLSKEEVQKNNKNVVERLYSKEMEKIKEKRITQQTQNSENSVSPIRKTSPSIKKVLSSKRDLLYKLRKEHSIKFKTEESGVKFSEENLKTEDLKFPSTEKCENDINLQGTDRLLSKESKNLQENQTPSTSQINHSTVTKTEDISTSSFYKRESKISTNSSNKLDESVRRRASNLIDKRLEELTRRRSSNKLEEKLFKPSYASTSNLSNNINFRSQALMNIIKERKESH